MDVSIIPVLIKEDFMNERDLVDWAVAGASIFSSLGVIVAVFTFIIQNKKTKNTKIKILKTSFQHHSDINLFIVNDILNFTLDLKRRKNEISVKSYDFNEYVIVEVTNNNIKQIPGVNPMGYVITNLNPANLEETMIACGEYLNDDAFNKFQAHIIEAYNVLRGTMWLTRQLNEKKENELIKYGVSELTNDCKNFIKTQKDVIDSIHLLK